MHGFSHDIRWCGFIFLVWATVAFPQRENTGPNQSPGMTPAKPPNLVGKTEEEIVAKWGDPSGRLDFGDESHLIYEQGTVVLRDGKVIRVDPKKPGSAGANSVRKEPPGSGPATRPGEKLKQSGEKLRQEQKEAVEKLRSDLEGKKNELKEKVEEKEKSMKEFEERVTGYRAPNEKRKESARLDESLGIDKLKKEIQNLEHEIQAQQKKPAMQ